MSYHHKRYLKNYLINKRFQLLFLLRFFSFTFLVLTIGGVAQYFISNRTVLREMAQINRESEERQKRVIDFLSNSHYFLDYRKEKIPPHMVSLLDHIRTRYNIFLQDDIKFMRTQINRTKTVLAENKKDLISGFWASLILVGVLINIVLSLAYGILLSHRLAGNHYRIQLFAKQLQEKNLASPLVVREKDFFQETAIELDRARVVFRTDLIRANAKDNEILKDYRL